MISKNRDGSGRDSLAKSLDKNAPRRLRKRLEICDAIFSRGEWHFTASDIHADLETRGQSVSLATVYNSLHAFADKGLIRRLPKIGQVIYFDTCVKEHAHIYDEHSGVVRDAPQSMNLDLLLTMPNVSDIVIFRQAVEEDDELTMGPGGCCG